VVVAGWAIALAAFAAVPTFARIGATSEAQLALLAEFGPANAAIGAHAIEAGHLRRTGDASAIAAGHAGRTAFIAAIGVRAFAFAVDTELVVEAAGVAVTTVIVVTVRVEAAGGATCLGTRAAGSRAILKVIPIRGEDAEIVRTVLVLFLAKTHPNRI
jgi:hypothetical protein